MAKPVKGLAGTLSRVPLVLSAGGPVAVEGAKHVPDLELPPLVPLVKIVALGIDKSINLFKCKKLNFHYFLGRIKPFWIFHFGVCPFIYLIRARLIIRQARQSCKVKLTLGMSNSNHLASHKSNTNCKRGRKSA